MKRETTETRHHKISKCLSILHSKEIPTGMEEQCEAWIVPAFVPQTLPTQNGKVPEPSKYRDGNETRNRERRNKRGRRDTGRSHPCMGKWTGELDRQERREKQSCQHK
jgi:hypothetical protein